MRNDLKEAKDYLKEYKRVIKVVILLVRKNFLRNKKKERKE